MQGQAWSSKDRKPRAADVQGNQHQRVKGKPHSLYFIVCPALQGDYILLVTGFPIACMASTLANP